MKEELPPLDKLRAIIKSIEMVRQDPVLDVDKFVHIYANAIIMRARITSLYEVRKNGNHTN
jgi:hypothetical protein